MYLNERTFHTWWTIFHGDDPLTEIRMLKKNGRKATSSGYFKDEQNAATAIKNYSDMMGVYAPINMIDEACYSRFQCDKMVDSAEATTSDNDIKKRRWILIDLDSKRPTGCNATDEELQQSRAVMTQIGCFLRDQGFSAPVVAMSGNGWHLYYRIDVPNNDAVTEAIQKFLQVLDMQFSNEDCDVDVSVFNASRIAKIIGTKSNKGSDTKERPQRESYFVKVPVTIEPTRMEFVMKVASQLPQEERNDRYYGNTQFNIEDFISKHGIRVQKRTKFKSGERLVLEECPFDSNHKAPDSAIFIMGNGAIGFRCLHNSCSHKTWRDVRLLFEPDAYTSREREAMQIRSRYTSTQPKPEPKVVTPPADEDEWLELGDIEWEDPNADNYIPTGITGLDTKIGGLALGDVTLMSGRAGAGKTSILNTITLNAVQRGYKVAVWSGELQSKRYTSWIDQAAAGKNFVKQRSGDYDDWYYCPKDIAKLVNDWLRGKVVLRNNAYGPRWGQLFEAIKKIVEERKTQLVILDNLASMYLDYDGERNSQQSRFIADLKDFAKLANIHVILVAHPRKEIGNTLLRMESISGTFDLVNLCDNVLLCHRVGEDFIKRATEFFGKNRAEGCTVYNEVIEIAKNRSHGKVDVIVGLHYEPKSRRFLNSWDEHIVYGWQEALPKPKPEPIPATTDDLPFPMPEENPMILF